MEWGDLFTYTLVLLGVATLVLQLTKRKQPLNLHLERLLCNKTSRG